MKNFQDRLLALADRGAKTVKEKEREKEEMLLLSSPSSAKQQGKPEEMVAPGEDGLMELCFSPAANHIETREEDEAYVVSEFTSWKPERLSRQIRGDRGAVYVGRYKLEPGFKYKFRFLLNGVPVNDATFPSITNLSENSYNYIIVQKPLQSPQLAPLPLTRNLSYLNPNVTKRIPPQ